MGDKGKEVVGDGAQRQHGTIACVTRGVGLRFYWATVASVADFSDFEEGRGRSRVGLSLWKLRQQTAHGKAGS